MRRTLIYNGIFPPGVITLWHHIDDFGETAYHSPKAVPIAIGRSFIP